MDNMDKIMQHQPNLGDTEPQVRVTRETSGDPQAAIRRMTGLNMTPEQIHDRMAQASTSGQPETVRKMETELPVGDPTVGRSSAMNVLTPEEAAQFQRATPKKVDVAQEADRQRDEHVDNILAGKNNEIASMLEGAINSESARLDRHEQALEDDEQRQKIFQTPEASEGEDSVSRDRVTYQAPIGNDDGITQNPDAVQSKQVSKETPRTTIDDNGAIDADLEGLVPAYNFEDDETEPTAEDETMKRPDPNSDRAKYAEYIQNLETVRSEPGEGPTLVQVAKEKVNVQTIPSSREKNKIVGDQAFLNSITKFKKDNFRTVTVPLVNSGFSVDIVGTGAVDLSLLYTAVDQNTLAVDYELDKMRTVLRNVVGTYPKIDRNNLRNMIHYADYNMMAYAHVAATLKDVELITTCPECGKDFHIICDSKDLLLNMDELREKQEQIRHAETIRENSLMSTNRVMTTDSGFVISMGHPSYAEYIQYLTELRTISEKLDPLQTARIGRMVNLLPFIRSVDMPNRVHTNNLFQRFMAIGLLSDAEYNELKAEVKKLRDQIIRPRFGVKRVVCPHCKHLNTDISYDTLDDLLFFHITVIQLMSNTEQ